MNIFIIKSFKKITILTLIFLIIFNLWTQAINAWWIFWWDKTKDNSENFTSIDNYWLSEIWVALSINIWTKFYEWNTSSNDNSLYNELISISTIGSDTSKTQNVLITKNLLAIRDYINILKIDLKSYLSSWDSRQDAFDSLINQFKIRYKVWYANAKNLSMQIQNMETYLDALNESVTNVKSNMSTNFKWYNPNWLNKNIDDYLEIKKKIQLIYTYDLFCNRFLAYYSFLNAYNKQILTTLKLNENAIVKNTYVVVPSSWSDVLNKLNLIYDEDSIPDELKGYINSTDSSKSIDEIYNSSSSSSSSNSNIWTSSPDWIFWDPFNLWSSPYETIKQSWKIDFWIDNYKNTWWGIDFWVNK